MIRNGTDLCFVKLLAFWYEHQTLCVYWQGYCSDKFCVSNGRKQSGVLSPYLFTWFVRPLISVISPSRLVCNIGGMFTNLFAYADDMVMLAPSWHAMQTLIKLLHRRLIFYPHVPNIFTRDLSSCVVCLILCNNSILLYY